jgi:hypothetical protein
MSYWYFNEFYPWFYSPLLGFDRFFSFLIFYTVGRTPCMGDQPVARHMHTGQHKHRINAQTSMPQVGFKPTISVFERDKTVHASDRAATVIGVFNELSYAKWNPGFRWSDRYSPQKQSCETNGMQAPICTFIYRMSHVSFPTMSKKEMLIF